VRSTVLTGNWPTGDPDSKRVFVSESTVFRVLSAENLVLGAQPTREPVGAKKP
jgi:hypothetical protein